MPFCIWNRRAAFTAVPTELEESAFLDGAAAWMAFWRVTLAMAISGIFESPAPQWSAMAALAIMMSVPVVILFLVLQKYLLNGFSLGTVDA
jgi:arabinogalactan oligomer / maltooligosaccharide transport system permease protein